MNTLFSRRIQTLALMAGLSIVFCTAGRLAGGYSLAETIERAITSASERYDNNEIVAGEPYRVPINNEITLIFSYEQFDSDLSRAFDLYSEALEGKLDPPEKPSEQPAKPVAKHESLPRQEQPKKREAVSDDPIAALMRAEKSTNKAMGASSIPQEQFDVYEQFRSSHSMRIQQQDIEAEGDMATLVAQRQAAEEQRLSRLQQQQELQSQAMQWQAQLDKQASEAARKAAEWEAQHSFGAYATSFLATVAQTAIGSFTGGLLNPIATELANKAVDKWFNIDPRTIDQYQIDDD